MSTFACRLVDHINRYVELRRSLGYSFESQAATLQAFGRFVKRRSEAGPLTQHLGAYFCTQMPGNSKRPGATLRVPEELR